MTAMGWALAILLTTGVVGLAVVPWVRTVVDAPILPASIAEVEAALQVAYCLQCGERGDNGSAVCSGCGARRDEGTS